MIEKAKNEEEKMENSKKEMKQKERFSDEEWMNQFYCDSYSIGYVGKEAEGIISEDGSYELRDLNMRGFSDIE